MAEVATPIVGSQAADDAVGVGDHRAHASSPGVMTRVREEDITEIVTEEEAKAGGGFFRTCLLYTSPSPRDQRGSRMPSSA